MLRGEREKASIATDLASIVGVVIGIKPSMLGAFKGADMNERELWLFTQKVQNLGLQIIFYKRTVNEVSYTMYFIGRSHKKAAELRDSFLTLWAKGDSAEIDSRIGELLGYPETAIRYYARKTDHLSERHMQSIRRNRFYAHSATHEDEEFEAYEVPIYRALVRHCPKATRILRAQTEKRWLN